VDPVRRKQIQDLFLEARERTGESRLRFLATCCGDDPDLLQEVVSLLAADEGGGVLDELGPHLASVREMLADRLPERVGPYEVDREIGRGGMGVVVRAHDPRLLRDVALKFLPRGLHGDPAAQELLVREARAASALDHPHICTIYEIGTTDDGRLFIAMPFFPRGTLAERTARGPLPLDEALRLGAEIADALDCAHRAGIVHRDVKPGNIALGERGDARVLDFGVALVANAGAEIGAGIAGTPGYMAPEQARGEAVDARADVWGLGAVLHEMLTGRPPFQGPDRETVRRTIVAEDAPDVRVLRPDLPAPVAEIVSRAMARDPAARFVTAGEMAVALRAAVSASARSRRSLRSAVVAAVLAVLVLVPALVRRSAPVGDPTASPDPSATEFFRRGVERYNSNRSENAEGAIALFRSALERDTAYAAAHAYLARGYAATVLPGGTRVGRREWLDSAARHARTAVRLAPGLALGHSALANVLRIEGRAEEAVEHYRRALQRDSLDAHSMLDLAILLGQGSGRPEEASIWLERGLEADPDLASMRVYAARRYRFWDLPEHARRHVETGLRLLPDNVDLLWEGVLLEFWDGHPEVAGAYAERFLSLLPSVDRERMLAWYSFFGGDLEEAREHAERAGLWDSHHTDLTMYAHVFSRLGARDTARAMLRRAEALVRAEYDPANPGDAELQLAAIRAGLGDGEGAIRLLQAWDAHGGVRSWRHLDARAAAPAGFPEPDWAPIRQDPHFLALVERNETRLVGIQSRVREALASR
jgi:serine/threonine protein kinase